jgi:flagellar biosynthesis/type III secretory pathway protein FliH
MRQPSPSAIVRPANSQLPGGSPTPSARAGNRSRLLKADVVAAREATYAAEAGEAQSRRHGGALEEAFTAGVAAGRAAAEQEAAGAARRGAVALDVLVEQTGRLTAAEIDLTDQTVLATVLELTGWVLRAEPTQASRSLLNRLSQAARSLAPGPTTVVRVNTADLSAVSSWARTGVEVVIDERLSPGEARLDRGDGSAVLTFSAALRRAADALGVLPEPTA